MTPSFAAFALKGLDLFWRFGFCLAVGGSLGREFEGDVVIEEVGMVAASS